MKKIIVFIVILFLSFSCSKENKIEILDIIKKVEPINLEKNIDDLQFIKIINNLNIEEKKVLTKNCNYLEKKDENIKRLTLEEKFILINYCNFIENKLNNYDLKEEKERRKKILEKYIK